MKVTLVNPPRNPAYIDDVENLGLGYLASAMRREGHDVEILDAVLLRLGLNETAARIVASKPNLVGISVMFQIVAEMPFELVRRLRQTGLAAPIIAGGHFPTFAYREILERNPGIDFIARGEGEPVLVDLANVLENGESPEELEGLAYRQNTEIISNASRPLIYDLDSLVPPARDTLPTALRNGGKASISTSRGCYGNCAFCSIRAFYGFSQGKIWRARSPESAVEEMERLVVDYGANDFWVVDDTFVGPGEVGKERAYKIAELLIKKHLSVKMRISCRANEVDKDLFALFKEAGVAEVFLGVESGVQQTLDLFNKGMTVEQNLKAINILKELDMNFSLGLILLHPYGTIDELMENLAFLKKVGYPLSKVPVSPVDLLPRLQVLAGTPIAERLKGEGRLRGSYIDYDYSFDDPLVSAVYHGGSFLRRRIMPLRRFIASCGKALRGFRFMTQLYR